MHGSQVEVLSHGSLGCFVTHCGWNSTMESLGSGVPMVAFPQWTDQGTNAKMVQDVWKTGVRVDDKVNGDGWLWHRIFAHVHMNYLNKIIAKNLVKRLPKLKFQKDKLCDAC